MRLITFVHTDQPRLGALVTHQETQLVYDLNLLEPRLPHTLLGLLGAGPPALDLAKQTLAAASPAQGLDFAALQLLAPLPRPGKIICIGQNYLAHAHESNAAAPPAPIIFAKFANTVIGPGAPIVIPTAVREPDYEGELGVVIGRRSRNVAESEALHCVAGYLPLNDVSARDWQNRTSQWVIGKTPDTFCPMGPALVTADEVPDVQNLWLRTWINDELVQEGHTSLMIFSVARLIADMSRVMTLEAGDIIATGTPAGVGAARTPPRWLRPGDVVQVEIETIGALENPVLAEAWQDAEKSPP